MLQTKVHTVLPGQAEGHGHKLHTSRISQYQLGVKNKHLIIINTIKLSPHACMTPYPRLALKTGLCFSPLLTRSFISAVRSEHQQTGGTEE